MQSKNRIAVPHTINAPNLVEEREVRSAARRQRNHIVLPHDGDECKQQHVAKQESVDGLAHDNRILADVEQQQHHELAGKQHGGSRRGDNSERKRDVKNAGQVRLEEMHHPERAKECAQSDPRARSQQGGENYKIKESTCGKQKDIFQFRHCPIAFAPPAPAQRPPLCQPKITPTWRSRSPVYFPGVR